VDKPLTEIKIGDLVRHKYLNKFIGIVLSEMDELGYCNIGVISATESDKKFFIDNSYSKVMICTVLDKINE
jgi:hypothetical protein